MKIEDVKKWIIRNADDESANEFFNTSGSKVNEDTGDIWVGNVEDENGFNDGNWADERSLMQYKDWMCVTYPQIEVEIAKDNKCELREKLQMLINGNEGLVYGYNEIKNGDILYDGTPLDLYAMSREELISEITELENATE